jgi:sugar phosphate isomerase/epimerase
MLGAALLTPTALRSQVMGRLHLGAQTNAWPIDAKNLASFVQVLQAIRRTGYEGFETGYFNIAQHVDDLTELRRAIEATGLTFFGLHIAVGKDKCDPETLLPLPSLYEQMAPVAKSLGARHWILSSIAVKESSQIPGKVAGLRKAAAFADQIDLPLLYHNHWWEFANAGAEADRLLRGTRDTSVRFLFDAGHAFHAGADVPKFLQVHSARIAALHLRDYKDGKQVALGGGTFPLADVVRLLRRQGWSGWLINEEDSDGKQKLGLDVTEPAYLTLQTAVKS